MGGLKEWIGELVVMTHWPGLLLQSISKSKMCKLKKPGNQIRLWTTLLNGEMLESP